MKTIFYSIYNNMENLFLNENELGLTDLKKLPNEMTTSSGEHYQIKDGVATPKENEKNVQLLAEIQKGISFLKDIKLPRDEGTFIKEVSAEVNPEDSSKIHLVLDAPFDLGDQKINGDFDIQKVSDLLAALNWQFVPNEGSFSQDGINRRRKLYDKLLSD